MRTLYHGSIEVIDSPLVNVGRGNLDFGKGFYLTDIKEQAETWASVKSRYHLDSAGIINCYSFDFDRAVEECRYKCFQHYDREWLRFIIACRNGERVWSEFDMIEGGVANDRVIDTIEAFTAGLMDEQRALGELSRHQPNNQICLLKQVLVDKYLIWKDSYKLI